MFKAAIVVFAVYGVFSLVGHVSNLKDHIQDINNSRQAAIEKAIN